jgi:uncharacterized membrane protein YsdA (DUF1294 family)
MTPFAILVWYLIWVLLMSIATLLAYRWDKREAQTRGRRIPELRLHLLSLLGGWPGALLGRTLFRHKTRKFWFTLITYGIAIGHGSILITLIRWAA